MKKNPALSIGMILLGLPLSSCSLFHTNANKTPALQELGVWHANAARYSSAGQGNRQSYVQARNEVNTFLTQSFPAHIDIAKKSQFKKVDLSMNAIPPRVNDAARKYFDSATQDPSVKAIDPVTGVVIGKEIAEWLMKMNGKKRSEQADELKNRLDGLQWPGWK